MNQNKLQVSGQFLYSFTVVAKHMSFTKAAEDLCITQSAVSHRIRCLEQELGFPLFHRLTRKIILTEEGKTLYGALDASLKQIHETIRNIQEAELQGDLVIACAPSIAGCWLLPLLPEFQHEHPSISLHIRSGNDSSVMRMKKATRMWRSIAATRLPTGCTRRRFCGTTCCPYAPSVTRGA